MTRSLYPTQVSTCGAHPTWEPTQVSTARQPTAPTFQGGLREKNVERLKSHEPARTFGRGGRHEHPVFFSVQGL